MTILAQAGLVATAVPVVEERRLGIACCALFGAVGTLTLPVFGLSYALSSIIILSRIRTAVVIVAFAISWAAVLGVYLPLVPQILASATQQFGAPLAWYGFLTSPIDHLLLRTATELFLPEWPPDAVGAMLGLLIVTGCLSLQRSDKAWVGLLLLVPVMGSYATLSMLGVFVEDRFQSFFAINLTLLVALGIGECLRSLRRWFPLNLFVGGMLILGSIPSLPRFIDVVRYAIEVPRENFKEAAVLAKASGVRQIVSNSSRPVGLYYYLPGEVRILHGNKLVEALCDSSEGVVFIDHPFLNDPTDVSCLEREGAFRTRLEQRERGEHIDVWVRYPTTNAFID